MKNKVLKKSHSAGKRILEKDSVQTALVVICILLDATAFCAPLLIVINQQLFLDIILTIGACVVVDGGADLLSILVFKDINRYIKIVCFTLMLSAMVLVFYRLGCFRIETVDTLVGGNLGLIDKGTVPGIESLGRFMAEIPVASSIFIFISGIVTHDPNKKDNDLMDLVAESFTRTTALNKAKVLYGTSADRENEMTSYIKADKDAISEEIDAIRVENDLLYNRMLAEHINADSAQITTVMEEE